MNKNGEKTKLLAAVAVLAMIMCVFAVALPAADAAESEFVSTASEPIDIDATWTDDGSGPWGDGEVSLATGETISNKGLGNSDVAYTVDDVNKVITITGTLNKQDIKNSDNTTNGTWSGINQGGAAKVFYNYYKNYMTEEKDDNGVAIPQQWGMFFEFTGSDGQTVQKFYYLDANEIKTEKTLNIKVGDSTVPYTVDLSGLELSDETVAVGEIGFGTGLTAKLADGTIATINGTTIYVSGYTVLPEDDEMYAENTGDFWTAYVKLPYMYFSNLDSFSTTEVTVKQVNDAIELAYPAKDPETDEALDWSGTGCKGNVKEKDYTFTSENNSIDFLIPNNGSTVTFTMTEKASGKTVTYNFNFADTTVGAELSKAEDINDSIKNGVTPVVNFDTASSQLAEDLKVTSTGIKISTTSEGSVSGSFDLYADLEKDAVGTITLEDFKGTATFRYGSAEITDGSFESGSVAIADQKDVVIRDLNVTGEAKVIVPSGAKVAIGANVVIGEGASLTIELEEGATENAKVSLSKSNTLTLDGTLTLGANVDSDFKGTVKATLGSQIVTNGTFTFAGNLKDIAVIPMGDGKIVNANGSFSNLPMNDSEIDDDSSINASTTQEVNVLGDSSIVNGGVVNVNGKLTINEGVTLTVEKGGVLTLGTTAFAEIDGTLVLEEGATFTYNGNSMVIADTMTVEGANGFIVGEYGNGIVVSGTMNIEEKAGITLGKAGTLTVAAGGVLNLNGSVSNAAGVTSGTIVNAGTVNLDSNAAISGATVQMRDGGVLNIENLNGTLTVTDDGMTYRAAGVDHPITDNSPVNTVNLENVTGVTITETLVMSTNDDGDRVGTNHMYIAGVADFADGADGKQLEASAATSKIEIAAGETVEVSGELTLSEGMDFAVTGAETVLTVSGTMTASEKDINITGDGAITVTGLVISRADLEAMDINAAHYEVKENNDTLNYYTTLESALAAAATDITVYGDITVTADATIPVGTDVALDTDATVTVKADVTLSVAAAEKTSGTLDNGAGDIIVKGTLYVADLERSDVVEDNVTSDVTLYDEPSATFTSVANALAAAQPGSTVEITGDDVIISKDLTIPAGVTLLVPEEKNVTVKAGVTVTVDGTLQIEDIDDYTMEPAETEPTKKDAAETVVNGMLKTSDTTGLVGKIAGAYYTYDDYSCISPLEVADDIVNDIEGDITVHGENVAGDVSFAYDGADGTKKLTVDTDAKLTATSISASDMTLVFTGVANTTVTVADATFVLKNVTGVTISDVESYTQDNVEQHIAVMTGEKIVNALDEDKTVYGTDGTTITTAVYLSGSVTVSGTAQIGSTAADAKTVVFDDNGSAAGNDSSKSKVPTFTVAADADVEFADGITFGGDVVINGAVTLNSSGVAFNGNLTVTGTFAVEEGENYTADAAKTVYVGITSGDYYLGAAASVDGIKFAGTNQVAYVGPSAILSDDITGATGVKSTVYTVDGQTYATAYAVGSVDIGAIKDPVIENRFFKHWVDEKGNQVSDNTDESEDKDVGASNCATVTAEINSMIYRITILANQAVDDITIDGNLMQYGVILNQDVFSGESGQVYYGYTATVDAGTHKILYTLKNGYSGDGVLSCVSGGAAVSGLDFTASGTPDADSDGYIDYTFQLTGFDKTGYVPESPDTSDSESDSGMTITDYLLIVLVVLIIVMAIIVAMRLMRS